MFKSNGRTTKPVNEYGHTNKYKVLTCGTCGTDNYIHNIEFGEKYRCKKCNSDSLSENHS